jgi:uncharacterized delta-60 repeat protein
MKTKSRFPLIALVLAATLSPAVASPGDLEVVFNPDLNEACGTVAMQPDGKIIIGGNFTLVGGVARDRIARLNSDRSLDLSFNPGANSRVACMAVQPDGKIIIAGTFSTVGGVTRDLIARLEVDGNVDPSFNPNVGSGFGPAIECMAIQPGGKILIGGQFQAVGGVARSGLARLNLDGSLDTGFITGVNGSTASVRCISIQTGGEIIVGGDFTSVGGVARNKLARLDSNGVVEAGFNPNVSSTVWAAPIQADGKIVIAGTFSTVSGVARYVCARLNSDGTLDGTFDPNPNDGVLCAALQADGKVLLGGRFFTVSAVTTGHVAQLNPDGTLNSTFKPVGGFPEVYTTAVQADGRIVVGGNFTALGGATRNRIGRLLNDYSIQRLTLSGATRVEWLRGGSSPETQLVTFELSTNGGGTWTLLGTGTRIAGGWERIGLSLPTTGQIRARARISDGSGSTGLVEKVTAFSPADADGDGLSDSWELGFWGTISGHFPADDFDRDGLTELEELGFGRNPTFPDAQLAPRPVSESAYLAVTIAKQAGVTYEAQSAGSTPPRRSKCATTCPSAPRPPASCE